MCQLNSTRFRFSDYYFSEENLQRDFFLRRKMNEQGWIEISLIAGFHRVQCLTNDVTFMIQVASDVSFTTKQMREQAAW